MQFESVRQIFDAELMAALDASMATEKAIYMIDEMRKNAVLEEQSKVTVEQATEVFGDDSTPALR